MGHEELLPTSLPYCARDRSSASSNQNQEILKVEDLNGITKEKAHVQSRSRPNLFLEVPSRSLKDSPLNFVNKNMPASPGPSSEKTNAPPDHSPMSSSPLSAKGKPSLRSLISRVSFKLRRQVSDIEKANILAMELSLEESRERSPLSTSFSFKRIFTPTIRRTFSLPVITNEHSNVEPVGKSMLDCNASPKKYVKRQIDRSLSVPVIKNKTLRRMDSIGSVFRVIPSTPRATEEKSAESDIIGAADDGDNNDDDGEDIPEEEAVCRICLVELAEGGDTLKMECSCKGELALAHQECAVKWFSIKGNKTCDICKEEVQNLPVTLLRVHSVEAVNVQPVNRSQTTANSRYRVWQDAPVLVIIGMLAYFCFLEQLLVTDMGAAAIVIALPFSCVLGLIASLTSSTMVSKKYVWIYASVEFGLIALFAHLFYSFFHIQAIIPILLASFAGFGVTMCGKCLVSELLKWRRSWLSRSEQNHITLETHSPPQSSVPLQPLF